MAFFDNSFSFGYGDVAVSEAYDVDFGGLDNIIAESYADELDIIKAIHAADMAELGAIKRGVTESADLAVAMEASIGDIFTTIKEKLVGLFKKIGAWFKDLFQKLFVFSKSNANFVDSYKETLSDLKPYVSSVKFTSYDWEVSKITGDSEKSHMNKSMDTILKYSEDALKRAEDEINAVKKREGDDYTYTKNEYDSDSKSAYTAMSAIRSAYGVTKVNETSVRQAVLAYYRKSNEKVTDKAYTVDEILSALDTMKTVDVKPFKKAEQTISKNFDKVLKFIDKARAEAESWSDDTKGKSMIVTATKNIHSRFTEYKAQALQIVGAEKTVATEFSADIKGVTVKAIAEGKANKKKAEKKSK